MKKFVLFVIGILFSYAAQAQLTTKDTDARAMEVLNKFMEALMIEDADKSAKEVMKYAHKSLFNPNGSDLSKDLRDFSFKKAHNNAKFYQTPVIVTRIRKSSVTGIGYEQTAERGRIEDYFIAKKQGVNGMPAPVQIFFPADGSEPKIAYMGSL